MEVGLHANMCDWTTNRIADALHAPFKAISKDLSKDYGGRMEHLWIDFELIEAHAQQRPPYSFRFQKKVGGSSPDRLTGLARRVYENVGHYSLRSQSSPALSLHRRLTSTEFVVSNRILRFCSSSAWARYQNSSTSTAITHDVPKIITDQNLSMFILPYF